ncbi:type II toxin-antitoxin system mRNA interferase toxin, RelE/StbE family [Romeria aff. gracilis LEGE 07310]|uniref:Type II toxin-antitoxin system mRNA interferase toxin, RelE/StbE family n=1 Tax=Vasconcelosia minhoensis LEGE 07310 TaxID=915328 RepID=A0A8J7AL87_9CYAN|nr:type II toxin-antitoxin system mRNA interferase toxin, RelE/StbE family [Romeria gracilis]MBE9079858.1 type II toxin-antitoxin system mRNA interferase toxin, RelE/StbE family [Romeria aff. gracilis LEGE 07310]
MLLASSFKRAFKRLIRRQPNLQARVEDRLRLLAENPFSSVLQTHRLKGKLSGAWACSVEYDCRMVFNFVKNPETEEDDILLIDIGSHDEVY